MPEKVVFEDVVRGPEADILVPASIVDRIDDPYDRLRGMLTSTFYVEDALEEVPYRYGMAIREITNIREVLDSVEKGLNAKYRIYVEEA